MQAKTSAPEFSIGVVDVRDLADAHLKAGYTPEAEGRHIVSAANTSLIELAQMLRQKYGAAYPFPTKIAPNFWCGSWLRWSASSARWSAATSAMPDGWTTARANRRWGCSTGRWKNPSWTFFSR